jgi:hypothetical protein
MSILRPPRHARDFAADLRGSISYFDRLGVSIDRGRIREYRDTLDAAARGEDVDRTLLWAAVCEVQDLAQACTLEPDELQPVRHRLAGVRDGDAVYTDTSGDDPGRNLLFELITASMLQANGSKSRLQNPTDVTNVIGNDLLLVECKRPTTLLGLGRCLKKGYRQLSEHRKNGHSGFGVIALEISVLINPQFGVLIGANPKAAADAVYGHIQRVLGRAKEHLARAARDVRRDANVHLLMFRAKCMTGDERTPVNATEIWHLEPTTPLQSLEFGILYRALSNHPAFTPGVTVIDPADPRLRQG